MQDLIKPFARFLTRDVPYLIGGASFLISLSIALQLSPNVNQPIVIQIFAAGVAYVVGYCLQELTSLTPLVNTSLRMQPAGLMRQAYKRWSRLSWKPNTEIDYPYVYHHLHATLPSEKLSSLERVVMLKHMGTAVGPSWLFSGALLLIAAALQDSIPLLVVGALSTLLGASLLFIGWMQAMEMMAVLSILAPFAAMQPTQQGSEHSPTKPVATDA